MASFLALRDQRHEYEIMQPFVVLSLMFVPFRAFLFSLVFLLPQEAPWP